MYDVWLGMVNYSELYLLMVLKPACHPSRVHGDIGVNESCAI